MDRSGGTRESEATADPFGGVPAEAFPRLPVLDQGSQLELPGAGLDSVQGRVFRSDWRDGPCAMKKRFLPWVRMGAPVRYHCALGNQISTRLKRSSTKRER